MVDLLADCLCDGLDGMKRRVQYNSSVSLNTETVRVLVKGKLCLQHGREMGGTGHPLPHF